MSDILAQIGARLGQEFKSLSTGVSNSDSYKEITYNSSGDVSVITQWEDNTKTVLVETKTLSYTSGILTGISVTDENGNTSLTQNLGYDSSFNLASITKNYA
jgi:hypothetical protein